MKRSDKGWPFQLLDVMGCYLLVLLISSQGALGSGWEAMESLLSETASKVSPSVVHIMAPICRETAPPSRLETLFSQWWPSMVKKGLLGSGFFVDAQGSVITTEHVVAGVDHVELLLHDGRTLPGTVFGRDPVADIALIRASNTEQMPYLPLGDSSDLRVGQWVMAVGSPMGLSGSVSLGIVSASDRKGLGLNDLDIYIQTDALLGPGSSGGPLLNLRGEVIGICIGLGCMDPTGGTGPGFAIPVNILKTVLSQLNEHGTVYRGWLGISVQDAEGSGSRVIKILHPQRKELRVGDIILSIEEQVVRDSGELKRLTLHRQPGEVIHVRVLRDSSDMTLELALLSLPGIGSPFKRNTPYTILMGASLYPRELGVGVDVGRITHGSLAWHAGLEQGDYILEINGKMILELMDVERILKESEGQSLSILLERRGETHYVEIRR